MLLSVLASRRIPFRSQEPVDRGEGWRCMQCSLECAEGEEEKVNQHVKETFHGVAKKCYVVDVVVEGNIAVEADGKVHDFRSYEERDRFLESRGFKVIHLPNELILKYPEFAADYIQLHRGSVILDRFIQEAKRGSISFRNLLAKMDLELTNQLAAAYRSQLIKGAKCPVCLNVV